MDAYTSIAGYYDILNDSVDYEAWADFLSRELGEAKTVLDLGCGTGNITFPLEARGYEMIGCDISCDMLSLAREKADSLGSRALFLHQDMTDIDLYGTVGGAVSCLDSVNYILSRSGLDMFFAGVYKFLDFGGTFIFDCNTPYKFKEIYGENHYVLEDEGVLLTWRNEYNEKSRICSFLLDIFTLDSSGMYVRSTECHRERCYARRTLESAARNAGFLIEKVVSDFTGTPAADKDERWYFILKKEKKKDK